MISHIKKNDLGGGGKKEKESQRAGSGDVPRLPLNQGATPFLESVSVADLTAEA